MEFEALLNNPFLVLFEYFIILTLYLVVIPLSLFYWMNNRWYVMGKFERLGIYGLVFLFFPGLILFSPFLNLRLNGKDEGWKLTKIKVVQIGLFISLAGFLILKIFPFIGADEISTGAISNLILFSIIFVWVSTYILRVVNGKMTFMEQRKRYREEYEKVMDAKLKKKFNTMTPEEQNNLLKELEEN